MEPNLNKSERCPDMVINNKKRKENWIRLSELWSRISFMVYHPLSLTQSPALADGNSSEQPFLMLSKFVILCCGSLLEASDGQRGLSPSLQKILYILHWMLLDSASECAENSGDKEDVSQMRVQGLFSISSIQLFVYLIAPLADVVSEEDISSNIRLESGLKIWQALWQYRQPDVWCFHAPVKQRRDELPMVTFVRRQTAVSNPPNQGIYLGDDESKPRRPSIVPPPKPPRTDQTVLNEKRRREQEKIKIETKKQEIDTIKPQKPKALVIEMPGPASSPTAKLPTERTSSIVRSVSEYKATEVAVDTRNRISKSNTANAFDISPTSTTDETTSSSSQLTVVPLITTFPKPKIDTSTVTREPPKICEAVPRQKSGDGLSTDDELDEYSQPDPTIATFLDMAVIRALLIIHWQEQGVYWAMRYLLNRLEEIQIDITYQNPTWEEFQLPEGKEEEDRTRLHVAFNDSRSDPSLNNSTEILSIREDSGSMSNVSSKSADKVNEKIAAQYYPEIHYCYLVNRSNLDRNKLISNNRAKARSNSTF
uniref:UNC80 domain-containing protein n=1 Tax=Heterorhabditis bacteriophora TaxID=37862 RepID=A0A1I7XNI6_HETBA